MTGLAVKMQAAIFQRITGKWRVKDCRTARTFQWPALNAFNSKYWKNHHNANYKLLFWVIESGIYCHCFVITGADCITFIRRDRQTTPWKLFTVHTFSWYSYKMHFWPLTCTGDLSTGKGITPLQKVHFQPRPYKTPFKTTADKSWEVLSNMKLKVRPLLEGPC